jgi:hypothetical protein
MELEEIDRELIQAIAHITKSPKAFAEQAKAQKTEWSVEVYKLMDLWGMKKTTTQISKLYRMARKKNFLKLESQEVKK